MVRGLSNYVSQARQLQKLKEEDDYCRAQLKAAHFLLYSKGRPLLRPDPEAGRTPLWLDYRQSARLLRSQLEESCVLLGLSKDGSPQLAVDSGKYYKNILIKKLTF
jgi:hypothetical protein